MFPCAIEAASARFDQMILLLFFKIKKTGALRAGKTHFSADIGNQCIAVSAEKYGDPAQKGLRAGKQRLQSLREPLKNAYGDICPAYRERFRHAEKIQIFRNDDPQLSGGSFIDLHTRPGTVSPSVDTIYHIRDSEDASLFRNNCRFSAHPARIGETAAHNDPPTLA